jgi:hypothetical protein
MATATTASPAIARPAQPQAGLSVKDKVTLGLLAFYMLMGWTIESYWLLHNNDMEAHDDLLQKILAFYWPADRTYRVPGHDIAKSFTLALESFNVCVIQPLQIWLVVAIMRRRHYRYVLQLVLATLTWYGTFLYYYVAHISGYAVFEYRGTYPFVMFYTANTPWLFGYAWLIWEAIRALNARLRAAA